MCRVSYGFSRTILCLPVEGRCSQATENHLRAAVQGLAWFSDTERKQKTLLQRWTLAFMKCTMAHVQEDCDLHAHLKVPHAGNRHWEACFGHLVP